MKGAFYPLDPRTGEPHFPNERGRISDTMSALVCTRLLQYGVFPKLNRKKKKKIILSTFGEWLLGRLGLYQRVGKGAWGDIDLMSGQGTSPGFP